MSTTNERREAKKSIVLIISKEGFTIKQRLGSKILKTFSHKPGHHINWDEIDEFPCDISFLIAGGKECVKSMQKKETDDNTNNE